MADKDIEKSFCTTREAATLLGVSVGTVQLWVENGLLRAWKTAGGHRRVLRESVNGLLHQSSVPRADRLPKLAQPVTRPFSVLVVEDDEVLLALYRARIGRWPMAPVVMLADNAISGLLLMGRTNPDMLITDLDMPGMDGFHMLRVLQATPEFSHTQVVVVSGLDASEVAHRGGIPEGIPLLPKPIQFQALHDIACEHQRRSHRAATDIGMGLPQPSAPAAV